MKAAVLGFVVALLLFVSASAHALLGWPQFRQVLEAAGVAPPAVGALSVGWYFGSTSMLTFAGIVFRQALRRFNRQQVQAETLWIISTMYVMFRSLAFVFRAFNPHFLLFVVTGILVGLFGFVGSDPPFFAKHESP